MRMGRNVNTNVMFEKFKLNSAIEMIQINIPTIYEQE